MRVGRLRSRPCGLRGPRRRAAWFALLIALMAGAGASPARAQRDADRLRIVWRDAITNIDPYRNQLRSGLVVAQECWDTLVYADPNTLTMKPLLATAWRQVDDVTLEFTLREGVRFHNGDPFDADDVVYTVNIVARDPAVAVPGNTAFLDHAERIDATHVRLVLRHPYAAALATIAAVLPILPHDYRERVGAAGYATAPVGTGPYRIAAVEADGLELERWDGYFAGPKGRPAIGRLSIHTVPAGGEVAALLDGRADWTWQFGADALDAIDHQPALQSVRAESMRFGFLGLDAAGRTGAGNPLTRLEVRQAVAAAVDRDAFSRAATGGAGRPLRAPCYPTQFGCDQSAAVVIPHDVAAAKAALAKAGLAGGFATRLFAAGLPASAALIQQDLQRVGIDATVMQLPANEAVGASQAGDVPLSLASWGSYSINDIAAVLSQFFGGGPQDYARDPALEALVAKGDAAADPDTRRPAYAAAIHRITEQAYWVPLTTYITTYAFTRDLVFQPFADELPRFYLARWR